MNWIEHWKHFVTNSSTIFSRQSVKTMVNQIFKLTNVWIYRGFFTRGSVDFVLYGFVNSFGWFIHYLLSQRHFRFYNIQKRLFLCFQQNSCFVNFLGKCSWWSLFKKDTKCTSPALVKKDFSKVLDEFSRATIFQKTFGNCQKQPPEVFYKDGVLKTFSNFTGKHLCQSLFLIKLQAEAYNFIKKETLTKVFSFEFWGIFTNTFVQNTSGRLLLNRF